MNLGISPYFKGILEKRLIESKSFFVFSYDESLNDKIKNSEMNLRIRYGTKNIRR